MNAAFARFGKHAGIYTLSAAASLVASLIQFPLYAAFLRPTDLGIVTTIRVVQSLALAFARMGFFGGMFRFMGEALAQGDRLRARSLLWTGLLSTIVAAIIVTGIMIGLAPALVGRTLGTHWVLGFQMEAAVIVLGSAYDIALSAMRASGRPVAYLVLFAMNTALNLGLTVLLVGVQRHGAYGLFAADFFSALAVLPPTLILLAGSLGRLQFSWSALRRIARFGVPIMPSQVGEWAVTFSDRLFLSALSGASQVGIYSLGYRLGSVEQQIVTGGFQLAWDPFVVENMHKDNAPHVLGISATYTLAVSMIPVVILGAVATPLLIVIHSQHAYLGAAPIVFLVALAYWFAFARYIFVTSTFVKVKPEWGTVVLFGTGALNVGLNFLLISRYGMVGAAWATLLAYGIGAIAALGVGRWVWRIDFEYYRLTLTVGAACLTHFSLALVQVSSAPLELALKLCTAPLLFVVILTVCGFWRAEERQLLRKTIRSLRPAA